MPINRPDPLDRESLCPPTAAFGAAASSRRPLLLAGRGRSGADRLCSRLGGCGSPGSVYPSEAEPGAADLVMLGRGRVAPSAARQSHGWLPAIRKTRFLGITAAGFTVSTWADGCRFHRWREPAERRR